MNRIFQMKNWAAFPAKRLFGMNFHMSEIEIWFRKFLLCHFSFAKKEQMESLAFDDRQGTSENEIEIEYEDQFFRCSRAGEKKFVKY